MALKFGANKIKFLKFYLLMHDSLNNKLPNSISHQLFLVDTIYNLRNETYFQLKRPNSKTITYGVRSIKSKSVDIWNFVNKHFFKEKLHEKSRTVCKKIVKKFLIDRY